VLLWGRDLTGFGVMRADNFALFINVTLCIIGVLTIFCMSRRVWPLQIMPIWPSACCCDTSPR